MAAEALFSESPWHVAARNALQQAAKAQRPLWISRQVLREYVVILTRPQTFANPLSTDTVIERVRYLQSRFQVADDTDAVSETLLQLIATYAIGGKQIHDANIVATMQVAGISRLLTNNVKNFTRFSDVIAVERLDP